MSANPPEIQQEREEKTAKDALDLINTSKTLKSKKLDLCRKRLYDVPAQLFELNHLEFLYLEGNNLKSLPEDLFTTLTNLKWLDLRKNQLTILPSTIGESRCLRSLLLENNKLERLPLELGLVKSLSGLHVADNPLEFPPASIIEQGTQTILGFLRDHLGAKNKATNQEDVSTEYQSTEDNVPNTQEWDRAQRISPNTKSSMSVKLPPIVASNGFKDKTLTNEQSSDSNSTRQNDELNSDSSSDRIRIEKKLNRKSPEKSPRKSNGNKKERKVVENQKESPIKSSVSMPKVSASPTKTSPKRRKKNRSKNSAKSEIPDKNNIMKASLKETGTFDVNYEKLDQNQPANEIQRQDTIALNEKYKEIIDEEKRKTLKVQELIKEEPENKIRNGRTMKFDVDSLVEGDMVAVKVAERHYIPGQPCLGKVVSLPDKTGLVLIHYYSGSYDGVWRPMMSRSSPYLRRIPASMIILKFELTEDFRMTADTIKELKVALEEISE